MKIERNELGNNIYGTEKAIELTNFFKGCKIEKIEYNYFSECFYVTLDNGYQIPFEKLYKQ